MSIALGSILYEIVEWSILAPTVYLVARNTMARRRMEQVPAFAKKTESTPFIRTTATEHNVSDNNNIVSLETERAHRSRDARDWTPLDALKFAVQAIENGEMDPELVYIAMHSKPTERGTTYLTEIAAGGNNMEFVGLLMAHIAKQTRVVGES